MIKIISILLSVTFVAGCSTVAGVGQDVQDVANWGRNKIVENANKKEVVQEELTEEDLDRIEAMRNHLPDEINLMADANEAWRVDQAMKAFNEIEQFNLVWIEEPIKPDDFNGYKYLKSLGKVPIAAGENLHSMAEFNQ